MNVMQYCASIYFSLYDHLSSLLIIDIDRDAKENKSTTVGLMSLFTFTILFNVMVPISLYVSLEVVKVFQSQFINQGMRERGRDGCVCICVLMNEWPGD
eukprot:GABW01000312.1.p1 GENE.GABW01000312.1~~GABW01000312.1.p1  ORF type:complete len:99 (-),score=11.57 GABW01000312.1:75-371(-)